MLRSINARAIAQSRLAPQLGSASVRRLSTIPRPSTVALGKRPALPAFAGRSAMFGAISARHISFFNGDKPDGAVDAAAPAAPVTKEATTSAAAAEPSLATPEFELDTPVPASDMPAAPHEAPLPAAEHLTSTAPDHQFHSDPTSLLPQGGADAATPTLQDLIANSGLPLQEVLNSPEAVHAAIQVSDLKIMGFEHGWYNVAGWLREALVGLHGMTDLPWWATIAALTIGIRMCLFPVVIKNMKHNTRLQAVSPQMQALMKRVSEAKKSGDQNAMMVASSNLQKLFKDYKVNPFGPLIMPLFQMPVFLGMFYALKALAYAPLPQLKDGGMLWLTDLTACDPYCILPITSFFFQLAVFKVGIDGTGPNGAQSARTMAHFRNGMMALSPLIIYTVWNFPAAVLLYWTTTNAFNLVQAFFLRQQWVRKLLRIPPPPEVTAPPESEIVDVNPSMRDTWDALRGWESKTRDSWTDIKQKGIDAQQAAQREKANKLTVGTADLYQRVSEGAVPVSSSATVETTPVSTISRAEAKRRRVDQARAKRAGQ